MEPNKIKKAIDEFFSNPEMLKKVVSSGIVDSAKLNNWRRRGVPSSFIDGAKLMSYLILEDESLIENKDFLKLSHLFFKRTIGLEFDSVDYSCTMENIDDLGRVDTKSRVIYKNPKVSSKFKKVKFTVESFADANDLKNSESEVIECRGAGIQKSGECIKSIDKGRKRVSIIQHFEVDESANEDSEIEIKSYSKNSFAFSPVEGFDRLQYVAYRVSRPTKKLSIRMRLPDNTFNNPQDVPVHIYVFGPWSLDPKDFDYNILTSQLAPNNCQYSGELTWEWENDVELSIGMAYCLCVDTEVTKTHLLKDRTQ